MLPNWHVSIDEIFWDDLFYLELSGEKTREMEAADSGVDDYYKLRSSCWFDGRARDQRNTKTEKLHRKIKYLFLMLWKQYEENSSNANDDVSNTHIFVTPYR